jgi:hypothetical protein
LRQQCLGLCSYCRIPHVCTALLAMAEQPNQMPLGPLAADANGTCSIPSGSCPRFTSSSGSIASSDGTCPDGFGYFVRPKTCSACQGGFSGPACKLCKTSGACREHIGSVTAECASGLAYASRSKLKHYDCALTSADLATLLGSRRLAFSCDTQGSNLPLSGELLAWPGPA